MFAPDSLQQFAPAIAEIYLAIAICFVLMVDVFAGHRRGLTATVTLLVIAVGAALTATYGRVPYRVTLFSGTFVADDLSYVLKLFSFLFGLIHGFGFAGALAEMELPTRGFVLALLQFNLGVEAGQLVVVFSALGALLALRHWRRYEPVLLHGGSTAALLIAGIWFMERVFDLKVLPVA